ncbi:MAG: tRNA pseudouridine(55) synthase TruB [Candidatus Muirbacterium halophilum]|nr:tRNA pseudouridine(55) synthase TruB [Candidatus Muirbacterium halophilum]MCK9475676.1 tRNA pseudouridine(55) synthase TruB [Candidatus Muirbacterium halophilum]
MFGLLNINKPRGISSFDVIRKLKKILPKKFKIGYLGTLDPMAKGVLLVMLGKTTKLADFFMTGKKSYIGRITFGFSTDSLDITGEKFEVKEDFVFPDNQSIKKYLKSITGSIMQLPPDISAKKINGKRAYELQRSGLKPKLKPVKVHIYSIKLIDTLSPDIIIEVECSKGTYIRSIARDIGEHFNIPSCLSALTRTSTGDFLIDDSKELQNINTIEDIKNNIIDPSKYIDLPCLYYSDTERLSNGVFIRNKEKFNNDEKIKILEIGTGRLLAIYKTEGEFLKPDIMLI